MHAEVQPNAPSFPDEEQFLSDLRSLGTPNDGKPFSRVAIAYEGAKIRVIVACHDENEDVAVCTFLDQLGLIDLLSSSKEVDEAIGESVASGIRTLLGDRWDSLYVRKPRQSAASTSRTH
jgi:hypothetical protein